MPNGLNAAIESFLKNQSRTTVLRVGIVLWVFIALLDLGSLIVLREAPTLVVPPGSHKNLAAPPPPPERPLPSPPSSPPPTNHKPPETNADEFAWWVEHEYTDEDYLVKWSWEALVSGLHDFKHDTVDILLLYCIRLFITIVLARVGVLVGRPNLSKISCPVHGVQPLLINDGDGQLHQLSHEADRGHLESYQLKKRAEIKKNINSGVMFLVSTAAQIYTGVKVIMFVGHWKDGNAPSEVILTIQGVCFFSSVVFINLEAFIANRLVDACCTEEGFLVPEFHPHRLFFAKMPGHVCDMCRAQSDSMYRCDACDFDACPACFNKKDKATGEGVMRGDQGVRDVLDVGRWDYFKRGIRLILPHLPLFLFALLCLVLQSVASLVLPKFQGNIFDHVISAYHTCSEEPGSADCDHHRQWFFSFMIYYVVISVALGLLQALRTLAFQIVARRIGVWVRGRLFRILMRQDIAFFDGMRTGDLQSRLSEDVAYMITPIYTTLSTVLSNVMLLGGGVVMCFLTSWRLSMLAFTTILPMLHITGVYAEFSRHLNKQIYQHYSDVMSRIGEAINMVRTVRAMSTEELEVERNDAILHKALVTGIKDAIAGGIAVALNDYLDLLAGVLILLYGGSIAMDPEGSISVGQLITYQLYFNMINTSIQALNDMVNSFTRAAGAAERVLSLYDLTPDIDPDSGADVDAAVSRWDIAFEDVEFHYQMRPEQKVLQGVSFGVEEGHVCALVGRSGGGKSTMIHLLLRFYDPRAGRITLGGVDLRRIHIKSFHRHVGVVSQETQLFNSTIGENISYGMEGKVTNADIVEAAKAAQAFKFISEFEDGLSTRVGERGQRLSGGQKQRIAIARCLLRKPKLLLLDEATSALDAESEALVQKALDVLIYGAGEDGEPVSPSSRGSGKKTVVLVAHRLSTVINSHTIVAVDKGRVAEQGTHEELLEADGVYALLVKHQVQKQQQQMQE